MSSSREDLVGQVVGNSYRLERLLGRGAVGVVYLASHLRLSSQRVAVKVLLQGSRASQEHFARFRREAEITSALRHPHIVQVLDFDRLPSGEPCLVMELLEGENLQARLQRRGALPYIEVVEIVRALGSALAAAHGRGVTHRDLKPANVFLTRHEQGQDFMEVPKVVDFGISKLHDGGETDLTRSGQILGTPRYMAPEQLRGELDEIGPACDQWALAVIAYECLCGVPPFSAPTFEGLVLRILQEMPTPLRERVPGLPPPLCTAVERALCKQPAGRFESVAAFTESFCGRPLSGPVAALPSQPLPPAPPTVDLNDAALRGGGAAARGGGARVLLGLLGLLLLAVGSGWLVLRILSPPAAPPRAASAAAPAAAAPAAAAPAAAVAPAPQQGPAPSSIAPPREPVRRKGTLRHREQGRGR